SDCDERQVKAICTNLSSIWLKLEPGWSPGRFRFSCRPLFAVFVGNHFEGARFINDIVPAKAIFVSGFLFSAKRFAVEKQLAFLARSKNVNRGDLPFTLRKGPVRQDMSHRKVRPPMSLIYIKPIFFESGEIDNA